MDGVRAQSDPGIIVHVLPDVTTPNRDCKSLKQGINWLRNIPKSRLKIPSSVGDKNAGIL